MAACQPQTVIVKETVEIEKEASGVADRRLEQLRVVLPLAHAGVEHDLQEAWHLVRVLEPEAIRALLIGGNEQDTW